MYSHLAAVALLQEDQGALLGGTVGALFGLVVAVLAIVGLWRVFSKAGQPGWAAIIPIYNIYVLTAVTGQPWWLIIFAAIPLVNIFAMAFLYLKLAERFGLSFPFALGLLFLPFIFFPILGFGDAVYTPPRSSLANG